MFGLKQRRRRKLAALAFPVEWEKILHDNVPFYHYLSPQDQRELQAHIQVFLAEKCLEGCGGLTITDEIRVTIAAYACILLLHRKTDFYPRLVTILVYPHPFVAERHERGPAGMVLESRQTLAGQSWHHGVVILTWDQIKRRAVDVHDGHNVAFHEFAHQLDEEDGCANGVPLISSGSQYRTWGRVLGHDYEQLVRDAEEGFSSLLDTYGAKNPAEFFAVVTEFFFEMPVQLQIRHPELYAVLMQYYQQDPAAMLVSAKPGGASDS